MPYQSSKLLSFFMLPLWRGRKVTVSRLQGSSQNISFTAFSSSFWPLCWLVSLPFFFFSVWFLWTLFLPYHCPSRVFISMSHCLTCFYASFVAWLRRGILMVWDLSPSCVESQNHPVLSFSYSSDLCKVKSSLLWKTFSFFVSGATLLSEARLGVPVSLVTGLS